jgi:hypothetical protein
VNLSGPILKKCLETFFDDNAELDARVKIGVQDEIRRAVFAKPLENEFEKAELKEAIKAGWIQPSYVLSSRGGNRKIYMWMLFSAPQRSWWKVRVAKITKKTKELYDSIF